MLSVLSADFIGSPFDPLDEPLSTSDFVAAAEGEGASVNRQITSDPGVQQMPSIAVDPLDGDHLVLAYMDHSLVSTPGYAGIGVSVSRDGGDTWEETALPVPVDFNQGAANPIARFDDQGNVFVSFMAATFLGEKPPLTNPNFWNPERGASDRDLGMQANNGVFVARSDDGGLAWNQPVAVVSHLYEGDDVFFEVIPDLGIDTFPVLPDGQPNPNYGNLYVTWTRLYPAGQMPGAPENTGGGDLMIAVSRDGGLSWETQLQEKEFWNDANRDEIRQDEEVTAALISVLDFLFREFKGANPGLSFLDQARVTVGREGDIYVSAFAGNRFSVHHSTDGGASFAGPDFEDDRRLIFGDPVLVNPDGLPNNRFRTHTVRAIAADPTRPGHVYAVEPIDIADALGDQIDGADVFFGRSIDFGETWETTFVVAPDTTFLFSISTEFQGDLDQGTISEALKKQFLNHGISLSEDATISIEDTGKNWLILDGGRSYTVNNDDNTLNTYITANILNDDNHGQSATGSGMQEVISGQALPRLAADGQGNIGVIWYDTRRDPADHLLDVFGTVSTDGGQTFSANFRLTDVSFDADEGSFTNATGGEEFYLGDFIGLAMANNTAYAAWTDTRNGNQDIFFARYPIEPAPAPLNDRFEPNQTPGDATELGRVVQRYLPKLATPQGDEDWFRLEAIATGELIVGAVPEDQMPLLLELWDETGTTRLATGSDVLDQTGALIEQEIRFPSDAGQTFLVRILGADSSQGDTDIGSYSLRLQSLTADLGTRAFASVDGTITAEGAALYLVAAAAAGSLQVELTGGDNVEGDLNLQLLDPETFAVLATGKPGPTGEADSVEPNDAIGEANVTGLVEPGTVTIDGFSGDGAFATTTGDFDFYSFQAAPNQNISVAVKPLEGDLDPMLILYDSAGNLLQMVDDASTSGSELLSYVTETPDTYFLAVLHWESLLFDPETFEPATDPLTPGSGGGVDGIGAFTDQPIGTGAYSVMITVDPVGAGAIEKAGVPIKQGQTVLLLVTGEEGSSGDFTLDLTNLDQFTTPENATLFFPAGGGPSDLALGDLNVDGKQDLVVANALSNTVSVLLGNGDGTFRAPRQFTVGAYVDPGQDPSLTAFRRDVTIADFNSDNLPDIVATNFASSDVSVLLGRGDGTFQPQRRFDATPAPWAVDVGDLNGDGFLDLVAIDSVQGPSTVAALLGRGDGTFAPQQTFQVFPDGVVPVPGIRLAHLDADQNLDLIVSGDNTPGVDIYLGNGDGTFTFKGRFDANREAPDTEVADLDADGNLDIVVASLHETGEVSVLFGNGDGTFQDPRNFFAGQSILDAEIVDFGSQVELPDGSIALGPPDGQLDIILAASGDPRGIQVVGDPEVVILPGILGDDGALVGFGLPQQLAPGERPIDLDGGDVDGDGAVDIAVLDRDGILMIYGQPPTIVPNDTPETARDLGSVVHLVDQTQTIVPGHEDAYYTLTVPTEAVAGAGDEIIDFSALFEATAGPGIEMEGPGLEMEVFDSAGNLLDSGERFRVRAAQGEELLLHIFGAEEPDGTRGWGAYTLVIDVLPQVVSVEAHSLLPGVDARPGGPTTSLVITLQGDRLDLSAAENPGNYIVTYLGPDGAFGTADDRPIAVGGASIEQPIVYNPGANVEVSTGLAYPTAVRQTVTLLFAEPLPAGSYVIELSSAIQTAAFNETEQGLLADPGNFTGHPVVSFGGGQITEGARVEAVDLVLQTGRLGDLSAFETGTPFLSQLRDDLSALLDAVLSDVGDDPSVTGVLLDQILDRLAPSLGELGQRAAEMLVIFLDPPSFSLVDPGGNRAIFDLRNNTLVNELKNALVVVSGNLELVVVTTPGAYRLKIVADASARTRLGAIVLGKTYNEIHNLTAAIRSGVRSFTFNVGKPALRHDDPRPGKSQPAGRRSAPLDPRLLLVLSSDWDRPWTSEMVGSRQWHGWLRGEGSSSASSSSGSQSTAQPPVDDMAGGGDPQVKRFFDLVDSDHNGKVSLKEYVNRPEEAVLRMARLGMLRTWSSAEFNSLDTNGDGELTPDEFSRTPDDRGEDRGQIDGAPENADQATGSGAKPAPSAEGREALQAVRITRTDHVVDHVVDRGSATYSVPPASVSSDDADSAASHPEDVDVANTDGVDRHRIPQQPPQGLIELVRFLWDLLARGVGV